MIRIVTLFCLLITASDLFSQDDTTVIHCRVAYSVPVYSDPFGTDKKIGEVSDDIYLISPGGDSRYLVYANGITGYIWSGNVIVNMYAVRKLGFGNIAWKIERAKYLEAQLLAERARQKEIDSIQLVKEVMRDMADLEKKMSKGIYINSFYTIKNDYWGGCGFQITNFSKSTIKYLYLTVKALNPVDDHIATKIITAIGPIEPDQSGSYEFKDTFITRVLGKVKLLKLVVEYKNGVKKEFTGVALKNITDPETEL